VIPPEYYRVALACGLVYGSLVTIGDSQVRTAIADYVAKVFDFIVNTDRITSGHGENRRTTGYPLEADMMLAYFGTEQLQPFVDRDLPSYGWSRIYRNNPMRLGDFKWYFFEPAMMKEVREYMLTEGPLGEDARSDVIYAESAREYPYLYDAGTDREATNLDNYMVWGQDPSMIRLWETLGQEFMTIDGEKARTWNIENMNWEWEHFKQEGTFVGACTDNGYVSSELLRSTGIPAVCGDMRFVYGDGETIHSFPAYYNSHQQVLKTNPYQFIGEMLRYYEGRDVSPEEAHRTPLQTMVFGCQKMPWENFKLVDEYVALPFQVDYRRSYLLASARDPIIFGLGVPVGYVLRADKLY
jgi:hypothetical protein